MSKKELSFKEGYGVLKKNAELLESHEEPAVSYTHLTLPTKA